MVKLHVLGPLHEPRAKSRDHGIVRAQKKSVQRPSQHNLQHHVVWSRALKCSVKSYKTGLFIKMLFNEYVVTRVLVE